MVDCGLLTSVVGLKYKLALAAWILLSFANHDAALVYKGRALPIALSLFYVLVTGVDSAISQKCVEPSVYDAFYTILSLCLFCCC